MMDSPPPPKASASSFSLSSSFSTSTSSSGKMNETPSSSSSSSASSSSASSVRHSENGRMISARVVSSSRMPAATPSPRAINLALLAMLASIQHCLCLVSFFSPDDLKYTFGVDRLSKVPPHHFVYPRLVPRPLPIAGLDQPVFDLYLDLAGDEPPLVLPLVSITAQLFADQLVVVKRTRPDGGGQLEQHSGGGNALLRDGAVRDCHFHHRSDHTLAAISNCDEGELKGTVIRNGSVHVLHPLPAQHSSRVRRSADGHSLHVLYRRRKAAATAASTTAASTTTTPKTAPPTTAASKNATTKSAKGTSTKTQTQTQTQTQTSTPPTAGGEGDFCGIDNTISAADMEANEAAVYEDVAVVGQRLVQEGDLVVELAVFVDEQLWTHFTTKHGSLAWQKLQQYTLTMLSNIQLMYRQPSALPALTFRVVRYEVYQTQPPALSSYLHQNGNAQTYLDLFCRYQRGLGGRDWDHALMLTGFDIHRGYGANSISGIARLDGMCDPWNSCTLAEGLDFTSAFIGTHELGHAVGMRHDEPYCASTYIMSSSLGPGKVTWSTCSMRDYQTFIQLLDARRSNCLRTSLLREKLPLAESLKPGQIYDVHEQCRLMHGESYIQVSPRQDHYDGICHMIWCGQGTYGRIVTSHPALEGTFCGSNNWCSFGRCVPWTGFGAPLARPPVAGPAPPPPAVSYAPAPYYPAPPPPTTPYPYPYPPYTTTPYPPYTTTTPYRTPYTTSGSTTPYPYTPYRAPAPPPPPAGGGDTPTAWRARQEAEARAKYLRSLADWRQRTERERADYDRWRNNLRSRRRRARTPDERAAARV